MTYSEIVQKLLEGDQEVTKCFFYYDGKTLEEIRDLKRTDPEAAKKIKKPVCASFYRLFVNILYKLHEPSNFNYKHWVSALYFYLVAEGKLRDIKDPQALEDWLKKTATGFFTSLIINGIDPEDYYNAGGKRKILVAGGKGKVKVVSQNHDYYKKRVSRVVRMDDNPSFDEGSIDYAHAGELGRTDTLALEKDAEAQIREAISRISNERYREIINLLLKYPDASHKELAQKLGISETNFGARLNRAREQFEEVYSNLIKDNINI